jgi:hypothetical protein
MAEIIQHMNADHNDALVLLARTFARIESTEAMMTTVDCLGFHVRLKTPDGMRGARTPSRTRCVTRRRLEKSWWKWCNTHARWPNEL